MNGINKEHWLEAQEEEADWWGNCANTYQEEEKQLVYAKYLGIEFYEYDGSPYHIYGGKKRILDIGGGPSSLLLKTVFDPGAERSAVADPCDYPKWVADRYASNNITLYRQPGESIGDSKKFDEVWMYNVLQHTEDPIKIIHNGISALKPGGIWRVFEWVDTEINSAHPHSLSRDQLDEAFGRVGSLVFLSGENGCSGLAYYGAFQYNKDET